LKTSKLEPRVKPLFTDKMKGCHEGRFENQMSQMKTFSGNSKYIRNDRGFNLTNMSKRDDRITLPNKGGSMFYDKSSVVNVRGSVDFSR
jgi:hypothetical protein